MKGFFEHFSNWINNKKEETKEIKHSTILVKKEEQKMAEQQNKKKSLVTYVYGQVYRGYLESGETTFTIKNIHVREWKKVLGWMKKNKYIVDFELGDTFETACELKVVDFNDKDLIYQRYINAVKKNYLEEQKIA